MENRIEVSIEKLVYGGDGLGRLDGRVVLAPYVAAGERVRVEVERERRGLLEGRTVEIVQPAAERVAAECPYFGRCGGCHYQHLPYPAQLAAKRAILAEVIERVGKMAPPEEIGLLMREPFGYRNRVQLHADGGTLGYREARSHRLCAIERCPVASPRLNQIIATFAEMARDRRWPSFLQTLEVFTDEERLQLNVLETARPISRRFFEWCGERIPGLADGVLDYQGRFRVSRHSFFQVNRFLIDDLVETALGGDAGSAALDLYAGVGLFTLPLARRFERVAAVETGGAAVRDLKFNAERAGISNITAEQASVEAYLANLETAPDFVLADPPRAGLGKAVVRRLVELAPPRLTVVSCDPSTLARDLAGLAAGGYAIDRMTLVDLFPQTYHLETVVRLRR
ncbi:MAG: class I SAM-dependent RNA methyltransferase [Bryobacteraceae bacterium]